jgi:hypothetical protein
MRTPSAPAFLKPCLLARPEPFVDESPASWVQRLSGAHQYSLKRLGQVTNIHPKLRDWDFGVTNEEWSRLLKLADLDDITCGEARFAFNTLRRRRRKQKHLFHVCERPSYRWCSACFSSDSVPYLRWHWRLAACTQCRIHQCRLEERCPWCESPLSIHRALLVSAGGAKAAMDLSRCGLCGMPLVDMGGAPSDAFDGNSGTDQAYVLIDQLRDAYLRNDDQFEFDFSSYDEALAHPRAENPSATEESAAFTTNDLTSKPSQKEPSSTEHYGGVWVDMCINRVAELQRPTFLINGKTFMDTETSLARPQRAYRWTDGLRPRDRQRLATALQMIRDEKRGLRWPAEYDTATANGPSSQ